MNAQRILIVHNYYQLSGGEDTVVANEKQLLNDHGHKVIIYSRDNNELKQYSLLKRLIFPLTIIFNFKTYREIKQLIVKEHIDIVHVHNTLSLISPSVYYAAKKCKLPVVQTIHNFRLLCPAGTFYRDGCICELCIEHGQGEAVKHGCYRNSKFQTLACVINTKVHQITRMYRNINYICLTNFNKNILLQFKQIVPEKVYINPNFTKKSDPIIPYEKRENYFIFVGRIDQLKGIDILLKAWKLMQNTMQKLIICGTGPMEDWCKQYIADNRLNSVEMKGFVNNSEVVKMIGNSKALVFPTQCYEGFPMTIVEAFSVGTPVVASDLGNAGNLIVEGVTGTKFLSKSPDSLSKALQRVGTYKNISLTTQSEYEEKYTELQHYKQLMNIYEKIK